MSGDRLKHNHELTQETTDHTCDQLVLLAMPINIDDVLEHDSFLGLALLNELLFNVFSKLGKLLSTTSGLSVLFALGLSSQTSLFLLLGKLSGLVTLLVMSFDRLSVLFRKVGNVLLEDFRWDRLVNV